MSLASFPILGNNLFCFKYIMLATVKTNKNAQIHQILYTPKTAKTVLKILIHNKGVDIPINRLSPISWLLAMQKELTKKQHIRKRKRNKH